MNRLESKRCVVTGQEGGAVAGLAQSQLANGTSFWPLAWLALCSALTVVWLATHSRFGR